MVHCRGVSPFVALSRAQDALLLSCVSRRLSAEAARSIALGCKPEPVQYWAVVQMELELLLYDNNKCK